MQGNLLQAGRAALACLTAPITRFPVQLTVPSGDPFVTTSVLSVVLCP